MSTEDYTINIDSDLTRTDANVFFDANGDRIDGEVRHRNEYTVDEKGTLIRNNTYKVSKYEDSK